MFMLFCQNGFDKSKAIDVAAMTCMPEKVNNFYNLNSKKCQYCKMLTFWYNEIMSNNYAFIDGNNLHHGAQSQDINFDYGRLRLYLRNALDVKKAFLFIGYVPTNTGLYNKLQAAGFTLVFKPTIAYVEGDRRTVKGNVDTELVLHAAAIEYASYDKAVIVSSDGDFACLIDFLKTNDKLLKIITPTTRYSKLLSPYSDFILPIKTIEQNILPASDSKNRHSRSVQEP